jgi:hypothetical protein
MEKKYECRLLQGEPVCPSTPNDWFKIPFVMLSVAKRMSGKTCSMTQFLHHLQKMGKLDRLIVISPTYANNKHYFEGLPVAMEDVIEPNLESAQIVMDKLAEEGREYDQYYEKLKKWRQLQKYLNSDKPIHSIDPELLLMFSDDLTKKPQHRYGGRKPVIVAFFDDCQNTAAFSPKSKISYLTIKHRHVGQTQNGAIGCNLMMACQNYTSNSGGIPKTVRGNVTILCVFKNKNIKELQDISSECSGECDVEQFFRLHKQATSTDYGFLTIDFNRKKCHPSMFRSCWNRWLE